MMSGPMLRSEHQLPVPSRSLAGSRFQCHEQTADLISSSIRRTPPRTHETSAGTAAFRGAAEP
jgi:hypothetical protein